MKTLIIGIENASLERLSVDESVTNLRWLMQIGCYGTLQNSEQGGRSCTEGYLRSNDPRRQARASN